MQISFENLVDGRVTVFRPKVDEYLREMYEKVLKVRQCRLHSSCERLADPKENLASSTMTVTLSEKPPSFIVRTPWEVILAVICFRVSTISSCKSTVCCAGRRIASKLIVNDF
jgi:hypothetical protein